MRTMTGDREDGFLRRFLETGNATSYTFRAVNFFFVDQGVTISGRGIPESSECDCDPCDCVEWDGACYCATNITSRSFNITLREGWNALEFRMEGRAGANNVWNYTVSISHGNPGDLRWIFDDWTADGWSDESELSGRARLGGTDARPSFRAQH
jgi:hypothetical protein